MSDIGIQTARGARAPLARFVVNDELPVWSLVTARFAALLAERGLPHVSELAWPTAQRTTGEAQVHAVTTARAELFDSALLDLTTLVGSSCYAAVRLQNGMIAATIAAADTSGLQDAETWLRTWFPGLAPSAEQVVPVAFWSLGPHGGTQIVRQVAVPRWQQIAANYPVAVRDQLGMLMLGPLSPAHVGQLLLFHGEPGTGKTYALRALAWEWREWCDLHYVTDPEVFFGTSSSYMLQVVLGSDCYGSACGGESRWQLLVLEDTGELLAADARERTGQGLSRLLNLVDGLIGQGLRLLVLVTTNEPLGRLHLAVARPGRCAARIEFVAFGADEAADWLERAGGEPSGDESCAGTLAALYARTAGRDVETQVPFGFGV